MNAQTPILTPFALENAELLQAIAAGGHKTKTALGGALTPPRDQSNLTKTLKRLEAEGFVDQTGLQLTAAGDTALAAIAQLGRGIAPVNTAPAIDGHAMLILQQIEPDPLNPRKHFDEEAIAELADSIAKDGLLENLVVRVGEEVGLLTAPIHRLVAGERRWRAMKLLVERGDWPKDRPIMCKVVDIDDAAHRRIALVENLQRKDLRPIDEAQALKELMEIEQIGTAEIAKEIGFTQRFVQQRLQLLDLPQALKDQVNRGELTVERGREAASIWSKLPPIKQVELRDGKVTVEAARDWLAKQAPALDLTPCRELIILEIGWAIAAKSNGWWTPVPCSFGASVSHRHMVDEGLLVFSTLYTGSCEVRLTTKSFNHLCRISGSDTQLSRTGLEAHVRKARIFAVGGSPLTAHPNRNAHAEVDALFKEKRNATAWLNPPFAQDPAVKAERAAEAERRLAAEKDAVPHETWQQRQARELEARKRSMATVRSWMETGGFLDPSHSLEMIARTCGAPLPWRWQEESEYDGGGLVDADGEYVDLDAYGHSGPVLHLIVLQAMSVLTGGKAEFLPPKQDDDGEDAEPADDAEVPEALRKLAGPGAQPEASS